MRKGLNGLSRPALAEMGSDAQDGKVYLCTNRRPDRIKFVVWDSTGLTLYYRRLEDGMFELPELGQTQNHLESAHADVYRDFLA